MNLTFPDGYDTFEKRLAYCERAGKKLRLVHNGMGKWYRDGLTENQWEQFPNKIKNRYPYKAQITRDEFDDFSSIVFRSTRQAINRALLIAREEAENSTNLDVDLDRDIN